MKAMAFRMRKRKKYLINFTAAAMKPFAKPKEQD
jgi:hypothetical protein